MLKVRPKVRKMGETLNQKANQGVPHLEGCHNWKRRWIKMRKVMAEMRENMRRKNLVEELVHRTDSPFTASVNGHPLPPKFKMPSLDSYDGARDP